MTDKLKKAWDRQWRGAFLSTCAMHLDPQAAQGIGGRWSGFFSALPKGAKILDIGTGNGILPLIALQVSEAVGLGFELHGTDYAAIDPPKALPAQAELLSKIHFYSETPNESLPFDDQSFDALTAQHAFEYGDHAASAAEAARVLKKGGRLRFIMHAAGGEIMAANLGKIEQARFILEEANLFELVREGVDSGQGKTLKAALEKTYKAFENKPNTRDLHELLELLWGAFEHRARFESGEALVHWLDENQAELVAQKLRIEALQKAALDEKAAKNIQGLLAGHGVKAKLQAETAGGRAIGWLLEGEKA